MAREDILAALQIALTQKEGPPPPDENVLLQKMVAPNDTVTTDDTNGVTFTTLNPATFVWGGYNAQGQWVAPGWKYGQGQYK